MIVLGKKTIEIRKTLSAYSTQNDKRKFENIIDQTVNGTLLKRFKTFKMLLYKKSLNNHKKENEKTE